MSKVKTKNKVPWIIQYTLFPFKLFSAIVIGVIISLIGQALISYSYFSFMFIFLTVFFAFFTLVKKMGFLGVLLVDLLFVLMIVLLKVYIMVADSG